MNRPLESVADRLQKDKALLKQLRRRVTKARDFPTHTCPASRHVHIMADCLTKKGGYPMLTEEPEHCAITLYAVLASLWEGRKEIAALKHDLARSMANHNADIRGTK